MPWVPEDFEPLPGDDPVPPGYVGLDADHWDVVATTSYWLCAGVTDVLFVESDSEEWPVSGYHYDLDGATIGAEVDAFRWGKAFYTTPITRAAEVDGYEAGWGSPYPALPPPNTAPHIVRLELGDDEVVAATVDGYEWYTQRLALGDGDVTGATVEQFAPLMPEFTFTPAEEPPTYTLQVGVGEGLCYDNIPVTLATTDTLPIGLFLNRTYYTHTVDGEPSALFELKAPLLSATVSDRGYGVHTVQPDPTTCWTTELKQCLPRFRFYLHF